jgi:hypothetical protein
MQDFRRPSAGAGRAADLGRRLLRSGLVPGTLREAAWQATIRLQFLLQWDNEGSNGRRSWTSTPSVPRRRRCTAIRAGTPAPMVREPPDRTTGTCEAQHRRHRVPQRRPRRPTAAWCYRYQPLQAAGHQPVDERESNRVDVTPRADPDQSTRASASAVAPPPR